MKPKNLTSIEEFFYKNLHNKFAYISSDGLNIGGNVEVKCKLEFQQYRGLKCYTLLGHNSVDIRKQVVQSLASKLKGVTIGYDQREDLEKTLTSSLRSTYIQVAEIYPYDIKKVSSSYDNNELSSVEIEFKNGSTVRLRGINAPMKVEDFTK